MGGTARQDEDFARDMHFLSSIVQMKRIYH